MIRKLTLAVLCTLVMATASQAALIGNFVKTATNQSTNALIFAGGYDEWNFTLQSDTSNIDFLQLDLRSATNSFLQTAGAVQFQGTATNPTVIGFPAPDTFFVIPPGSNQSTFGAVTDTAAQLKGNYFASSGGPALIMVPNDNVPRVVAKFSVPTGANVNESYLFLSTDTNTTSKGVANGIDVPISFGPVIPEPASITLLGLALVGGLGVYRRRR